MRRHTEIAERIVMAAPSLVHTAGLVRSSHERYDGQGYPDRLAGEDIPLGASIIAVCDAFRARVSARPPQRPRCHRGGRARRGAALLRIAVRSARHVGFLRAH
jgi:HD-GYP domain-containing protein (c-di-GMP phosphodiesterase class II)